MKQQAVVQLAASLATEAAGPSYSVLRLAESLADKGHSVHLVSIGPPQIEHRGTLTQRTFRQNARYLPVIHRLHMSSEMRNWLAEPAREGAIVHVHGLWLMPNVYPGFAANRQKLTVIHATRGMLGPGALRFSPNKKRLFSALLQNRALEAVTCFHATSQKEVDDIRARGLTAPIALIPNGIDVPDVPLLNECRPPERPDKRRLLYLGRVHPKKGLDKLVIAWGRLEAQFSAWELQIVGPSEIGSGDALRAQVKRLGLKRVVFHEGLFGREKEQAFRDADVFVLPTLDENFGMVVAESLANGTPVICTKGAPWKGLETHRCGWWIDHGVEPLAASLSQAMILPRSELKQMGARGRNWMIRDFSWTRIAADMELLYRWCKIGGEPPDFVTMK